LVAIQIQKLIKHKAQTLALEQKKKTYFAHLPPKYEGQIKKKSGHNPDPKLQQPSKDANFSNRTRKHTVKHHGQVDRETP